MSYKGGFTLQVDFNSIKPIYLQIAEAIEDDILVGRLDEGDPAYSQLILSKELGVNPATAAKGIKVLVDAGLLTKERGKSMVVAKGAKSRIISNRQKNDLRCLVSDLVTEAQKIELSKRDVLALVDEYYSHNGGGVAI
ncbi:MAG: GntR family transcriptional regulator [Coriobacteriia bacterium]|nr:GntR family transcriptional regulator [Coriobacteriia bacterium]